MFDRTRVVHAEEDLVKMRRVERVIRSWLKGPRILHQRERQSFGIDVLLWFKLREQRIVLIWALRLVDNRPSLAKSKNRVSRMEST